MITCLMLAVTYGIRAVLATIVFAESFSYELNVDSDGKSDPVFTLAALGIIYIFLELLPITFVVFCTKWSLIT